MAEILPFRGVHYNKSLITNLGTVICPPYDVIRQKMQQALYQRSESNFIRVEFNLAMPEDKRAEDRYNRAAATLSEWLEREILQRDDAPALYLHDHYFSHSGSQYYRRGLVCLVKLEEWSKLVVRPHEDTLSGPKSDRLNLLATLQANTSPILSLYQDQNNTIAKVLETKSQSEPMFTINMDDGEKHLLWAVSDENAIGQIRRNLANQPLYIADGHHRYESALAYRDKRHANETVSGQAPYDYVMMNLVSFTDPGMLVLPTHRLLNGIPEEALQSLLPKLADVFKVEEIPFAASSDQQIKDLQAGNKEKIIIAGLKDRTFIVLYCDDFGALSRMIPGRYSDVYKKLDVSIIDHVILDHILGINQPGSSITIGYDHDHQDTINRVSNGEYQLALIINPVKPETIKAIADARERMPKKSTYFFPKAPAGLVFYQFG